MKLDSRIQAPGALNHSRRQVHAADLEFRVPAGSERRARAHNQDRKQAELSHTFGKPVEQPTIQRLVLQLVKDTPRILVRDPVIAGLHVADLLLDHLVSSFGYYFGWCLYMLALLPESLSSAGT